MEFCAFKMKHYNNCIFATFLLFVLTFNYSFNAIEAKVFEKCEFVKKLQSMGVPQDQLGSWTCIANYESNFNTKATNTDTGDYGILQISHLYWCSDSNTPGKGCNATCKQFLNDDITDDITCARHIYDVTQKQSGNGFSAWVAYNNHCKSGNNDHWAAGC